VRFPATATLDYRSHLCQQSKGGSEFVVFLHLRRILKHLVSKMVGACVSESISRNDLQLTEVCLSTHVP